MTRALPGTEARQAGGCLSAEWARASDVEHDTPHPHLGRAPNGSLRSWHRLIEAQSHFLKGHSIRNARNFWEGWRGGLRTWQEPRLARVQPQPGPSLRKHLWGQPGTAGMQLALLPPLPLETGRESRRQLPAARPPCHSPLIQGPGRSPELARGPSPRTPVPRGRGQGRLPGGAGSARVGPRRRPRAQHWYRKQPARGPDRRTVARETCAPLWAAFFSKWEKQKHRLQRPHRLLRGPNWTTREP